MICKIIINYAKKETLKGKMLFSLEMKNCNKTTYYLIIRYFSIHGLRATNITLSLKSSHLPCEKYSQ